MSGFVLSLALGFAYFISAVPAGVAAGAPVWGAALAAWIGYGLGGLVVAVLGDPVRMALERRFATQLERFRGGRIYPIITRYGPPALGLLAPLTIGPQIAALFGLAAGMPKWRLVMWIAIGVAPYVIAFAAITMFGVRVLSDTPG